MMAQTAQASFHPNATTQTRKLTSGSATEQEFTSLKLKILFLKNSTQEEKSVTESLRESLRQVQSRTQKIQTARIKIQKQNASLRASFRRFDKQDTQLEASLTQMETYLEDYNNQVVSIKSTSDDIQSDFQVIQDEVFASVQQLKESQEVFGKLKSAREDVETQLSDMNNQNDSLREQISVTEAEIAAIRSQVDLTEKRTRKLIEAEMQVNQDLEEVLARVTELETELQSAESHHKDLTDALAEAQLKASTAKENADEARKEFERWSELLREAATLALDDLNASKELVALELTQQELDHQLNQIRESKATIQEELQIEEERVAEVSRRIEGLTVQCTAKTAELQNVEKEQARLVYETEQQRLALAKADQRNVKIEILIQQRLEHEKALPAISTQRSEIMCKFQEGTKELFEQLETVSKTALDTQRKETDDLHLAQVDVEKQRDLLLEFNIAEAAKIANTKAELERVKTTVDDLPQLDRETPLETLESEVVALEEQVTELETELKLLSDQQMKPEDLQQFQATMRKAEEQHAKAVAAKQEEIRALQHEKELDKSKLLRKLTRNSQALPRMHQRKSKSISMAEADISALLPTPQPIADKPSTTTNKSRVKNNADEKSSIRARQNRLTTELNNTELKKDSRESAIPPSASESGGDSFFGAMLADTDAKHVASDRAHQIIPRSSAAGGSVFSSMRARTPSVPGLNLQPREALVAASAHGSYAGRKSTEGVITKSTQGKHHRSATETPNKKPGSSSNKEIIQNKYRRSATKTPSKKPRSGSTKRARYVSPFQKPKAAALAKSVADHDPFQFVSDKKSEHDPSHSRKRAQKTRSPHRRSLKSTEKTTPSHEQSSKGYSRRGPAKNASKGASVTRSVFDFE